MNLLQLHGLRVSYGGINAVKGIDLSVSRGELVCLIGTNGAGKTTTLKAIAGLLPVAADAILYDGAPIGGIKVITENGWFAARPSGTEDVIKLYAESFVSAEHLLLQPLDPFL